MIKSYKEGGFEMYCDKPKCPNIEEFRTGSNFKMMVKEASTNGWKIKKHGAKWTHICPMCSGG